MGCIVNTCSLHGGCGTDDAGSEPVCDVNSVSWTSITGGAVQTIEAAHLAELETAINNERTHPTRRYISAACPSNCSDAYTFTGSRGVGDEIKADHFNNVADANNNTPYSETVDGTSIVGVIIYAADIIALQEAIWNGAGVASTNRNCICDSYCGCDVDCTCNGVCTCNINIY